MKKVLVKVFDILINDKFAVFLSIGLITYFSLTYKIYSLKLNTSTKLQTTSSKSTSMTNNTPEVNLSLSEIAKHNSFNDCWVVINNKVYDVTSYINLHPGGAETLSSYCGSDATGGFMTKGGVGSPHSNTAINILNNFYIGKVGKKVKYQKPKPLPKNLQVEEGEENEYEEFEAD